MREWEKVDQNKITRMWDKLLTRFILPQGSENLIKKYTLKQWAIIFLYECI